MIRTRHTELAVVEAMPSPTHGLPRVESAVAVPDAMDDRLRDGFETLHTHRVMEMARAMRDGDSLAHLQGPDPLQRNRGGRVRLEGRLPGRPRQFTRIQTLDEEIEALAAKERKMRTSGKSYSVVIDRRTHKSIMVAKTVTLPKLDCSKAAPQGPTAGISNGGAMSHRALSEKEDGRRRGDKEPASHGRGEDGAQTDRTRRPEDSERLPAMRAKVVAAKASEEVTQWKKRQRRGVKKPSKLIADALMKSPPQLPPMRMTWKARLKETQASHEVTEWRGLKRFEKLERSWLDSEDEFRTLLASFELSRQRKEASACEERPPDVAEEGQGSSFFLTSELTEQPLPTPPRRGLASGSRGGHGSDRVSSEDEEAMNPSQIVREQIAVVAPDIAGPSSEDEDGDEESSFIDASALRQRNAACHLGGDAVLHVQEQETSEGGVEAHCEEEGATAEPRTQPHTPADEAPHAQHAASGGMVGQIVCPGEGGREISAPVPVACPSGGEGEMGEGGMRDALERSRAIRSPSSARLSAPRDSPNENGAIDADSPMVSDEAGCGEHGVRKVQGSVTDETVRESTEASPMSPATDAAAVSPADREADREEWRRDLSHQVRAVTESLSKLPPRGETARCTDN